MRSLLQSLRIRLAIAGFAAIYTPVLVLLTTIFVTSQIEETLGPDETVEFFEASSSPAWGPILIAAALLAPVAVLLAWWWAGRAVRPVDQAIQIQEQLIEEASHELRTPLSVLATNADVLLTHPEPTLEIYREGLERSRGAVRRMTDTIDSLLVDARGRARTVDRQATDLTGLSMSVVEILRPVASATGVTLAGPDRPAVLAAVHGPSVERALSNLVSNAIDHSPSGSVVGVDVEEHGAMAVITVTDQGPGVGEEDQEHVFDRYWQRRTDERDDNTDDDNTENVRGVGLGLSIVRQVAEAHGGEVSVTSPIDRNGGSAFRLTLKR